MTFRIEIMTSNYMASLPDIASLRKLSQSLAMLDAILSPEWDYRFYSFNSKWAENEMMASMRNGAGDGYFLVFNSVSAIIKGFDHESPMSPYASTPRNVWPGVLSDVPPEFESFLKEPAFLMNDTTFCLWRKHGDAAWQQGRINYPEGQDPDGTEELLFILDGNPSTYQEFAEEYYGSEIDLAAVEHVYKHRELTDEIIALLNPDISIEDLHEDLNEIGYPNNPSAQ